MTNVCDKTQDELVESGPRPELQAHIQSCSACSRFSEALEQVDASIHNLPPIQPPEAVLRDAMMNAQAPETTTVQGAAGGSWSVWTKVLPLAAAAALLIVIRPGFDSDPVEPPAQVLTHPLPSPPGELPGAPAVDPEEPAESESRSPTAEPAELKSSKSAKRKKKRRGRRLAKKRAAAEPQPYPLPSASVGSEDDLLSVSGGSSGSRPTTGPPESLDDSQIFSVLRRQKSAIKRCLEKQREADTELEGVMTVKMVIQKNGRTSKHEVSPGKFKNSVVARCVIADVRKWRFEKFSGRPIPLDFPVRVRGQ